VRGLVLPWTYQLPSDSLLRLPRLELVVALGTGVWDYLDVPALTARGIRVANVRDYATAAVAEHALALLLAVTRDVLAADRAVREGRWNDARRTRCELEGSTIGIVGVGSIGERLAVLAGALGMRSIGWTPHPERRPRSVPLVDLPTLLSTADVVSLHASWHGGPPLLGREELALLRPGAIVINTARGRLVDEDALRDALVRGQLGGAGLDVFAEEPLPAGHPLLAAPNLVLSPHHGADTQGAKRRAVDEALQNVLAFYEGRSRNVVNDEAAAAAVRAHTVRQGVPSV
jgi:phosphoglycerate dehydrogenase-like enzyme